MLWTSIWPAIHQLYEYTPFYFQYGARQKLPAQWIGRRGSVEYPPASSDLTLLEFTFGRGGALEDVMYRETQQYCGRYGQKFKRRMPISQCTSWPGLLMHLSIELRRVCNTIVATLNTISHTSFSLCIKIVLPMNYLSSHFMETCIHYLGTTITNQSLT